MPLAASHIYPLILSLSVWLCCCSCSSTTSPRKSAYPERQEIHFSTQGSNLKPVAEFLDIHTQTPRRPTETGTKAR